MADTHKTRTIILAIIGVAGAVTLVLAINGLVNGGEVHTIRATIARIDAEARTASVELVHPKTGQTIRIDGTVPPDCEILIDERPARLADLRVGDRAEVEGIIHRDRTIAANWVHVTRTTNPASTAPTTTRATEAP